jgi:hypothetical protein
MNHQDKTLEYQDFILYIHSLIGKSWADICFDIQDQEDIQDKQHKQHKHIIIDTLRNKLFHSGDYHLEDGEVFNFK